MAHEIFCVQIDSVYVTAAYFFCRFYKPTRYECRSVINILGDRLGLYLNRNKLLFLLLVALLSALMLQILSTSVQ